jgi:hypothetical protein
MSGQRFGSAALDASPPSKFDHEVRFVSCAHHPQVQGSRSRRIARRFDHPTLECCTRHSACPTRERHSTVQVRISNPIRGSRHTIAAMLKLTRCAGGSVRTHTVSATISASRALLRHSNGPLCTRSFHSSPTRSTASGSADTPLASTQVKSKFNTSLVNEVQLPKEANIVIIGGGVIGCSIASVTIHTAAPHGAQRGGQEHRVRDRRT